MSATRGYLSALSRLAWLLLAALGPGAAPAAAADEYAIGPQPAWLLTERPALTSSDTKEASDGLEYLRVDRQIRLSDDGEDSYFDLTQRIVSEAGVEGASTITIDFDPHTDRLTLHTLRVQRGATGIDQLKVARMTVLRRESELEKGLLDGTLTLSIVLEDVRVGDIVEYSYSRHFFDPTLGKRFADAYVTQWRTPVKWSRLRLLVADDRRVDLKFLGLNSVPEIRSQGKWRDMLWVWRDVPGVPAESQQPSWHRRYPRILASEWHSWADVVEWGVELFRFGPPSPDIRALAEQWREATSSPSERIILALRFVQDQVRYTGIEVGPGAYRPTDPARVLQRRFGDCKDKVALLVMLLRAMQIDAQPALVNTSWQHAILDLLPAPTIFDHAIVRVEHEGVTYWLDPTSSLQGGTLSSTTQAAFGAALVLKRGVDAPETMPALVQNEFGTEVSETFNLKAGVREKGTLNVKTIYRGREADEMRRHLQSSTSEEISREYVGYYRAWYPTIKALAPPSSKDYRTENRIEVLESYEFTPAFEEEDDGTLRFDVNPFAIRNHVAAPELIERTSPLAVKHPVNVRYSVTALLPEPWNIKGETVVIEDPAFAYRSTISYANQRFEGRYELRTLANHVIAERTAQYARKLEQVRDDASYWFTHAGAARLPSAKNLNIVVVLSAALGLVIGFLIVRRLQRSSYRIATTPRADAPQGIRGWLLLPALQTCIMPIALAIVLYGYWPYLDMSSWNELDDGATELAGQLIKLGYFALICSVCSLLLPSLYSAVLCFSRRREFPLSYIVVTWLTIGWGVLDEVVTRSLPGAEEGQLGTLGLAIRDVLSAILWTAYMLKSQRVAATFVRERKLAGAGATDSDVTIPRASGALDAEGSAS